MKQNFCATILSNIAFLPFFSAQNVSGGRPPQPDIIIHYLGHASFVLQFDNGVTVLTDYGTSNAYGLDSPIYGLGSLRPDVVTYSHTDHVDHCCDQVPDGVSHTLTALEDLNLKGLVIEALPTCERSLQEPDNTSYLFVYKGFRILHLGDAQAYIQNVAREDVRKRLKELYPQNCDLLLMTIEGTSHLIQESEAFIDLIQPTRVIPMHYWSPAYKAAFLAHLEAQNETAGKTYHLEKIPGPKYTISISGESVTPIHVISLEPALYV
jgi:L-ascorbate metabolism protein UlaG (beta-lactamase superfamily)